MTNSQQETVTINDQSDKRIAGATRVTASKCYKSATRKVLYAEATYYKLTNSLRITEEGKSNGVSQFD